MTTQFDTLLASLAGIPALPGARCRGRHRLFDAAAKHEDPEVVRQRHAQALGLCQHCPALAACEMWFLGLPKGKRPPGVIAGRINGGDRRHTTTPEGETA